MKWSVLRLLLIAAIVGCSRPPDASNAQSSAESSAGRLANGIPSAQSAAQVSASRQNAITNAVAKVSPSVVTVQTEQVNQAPQDPFDILFGRAQPRTSAGLGTGFVVRSDGVIVTNAHVVAGATKVSVMTRDGGVSRPRCSAPTTRTTSPFCASTPGTCPTRRSATRTRC